MNITVDDLLAAIKVSETFPKKMKALRQRKVSLTIELPGGSYGVQTKSVRADPSLQKQMMLINLQRKAVNLLHEVNQLEDVN